MAEIEVDRLTKRYGATTAVDELSFTVPSGRVMGFLGPNGAGKSTTLRALLGLISPTAGTATFGGRPYRTLPDPVRTVGASLESSAFHPGRSGRGHLLGLARAAGIPRSRVDEVLDLVELTPARDRRVGGYSLGMKQRLALAGSLLGDPQVLVLDEPANGLDPAGIRWLRDLLRARTGDGQAVLISSHVLSEVAQVVDDVVVITRGRAVAQSTLAELTASAPGAGVRVRSPRADELAAALTERGLAPRRDRDGGIEVADTTTEAVGDLAAELGVAVHELTAQAGSLEDVFLELTGTKKDANVYERLAGG